MKLILDKFEELASTFLKHGSPSIMYLCKEDIPTLINMYPAFYKKIEYPKANWAKLGFFKGVPVFTGLITPGTVKLIWN